MYICEVSGEQLSKGVKRSRPVVWRRELPSVLIFHFLYTKSGALPASEWALAHLLRWLQHSTNTAHGVQRPSNPFQCGRTIERAYVSNRLFLFVHANIIIDSQLFSCALIFLSVQPRRLCVLCLYRWVVKKLNCTTAFNSFVSVNNFPHF